MVNKIKYEMGSLFATGLVFSFLSHIADTVKENPYKNMSILRITMILLSRSIFGGIVAVVLFYGLLYYNAELSSELRIGLASAGAFMSEQISLIVLSYIKGKTK